MKKRLIATIVICILALVGIIAAHVMTNHQGQNIKMTETTLAGDYDAANGIEVTTKVQIDYAEPYMSWKTTTTLDEQPQAKSEMHQGEAITEEYHRFSLDTLLSSGGSYFADGYDLLENGDFDRLIPAEVITDLAKKIGPGETIKETINLGSTLDTVQMDYNIDSYVKDRKNTQFQLSVHEEEPDLLRSYFTVDVPDDYLVSLEITKDGKGKIESIRYTSETEIATSSSAYIDDDYCYLAVNGYRDGTNGQFYNLKDKEYAGILRIPLSPTRQMQVKEIEKIYPIDDGVFIESLRVSPDDKSLLLLTVEDDSAYLSVINKATMELKQKINLSFSHFPDVESIVSTSAGDNYYAAVNYAGSYVVLSYKDGEYRHFTEGAFDLSKLKDGYTGLNFWHCSVAADFDEDKIAVAVLAYNDDYNITPSYCIQVRNQEDLLYYGFFHSSLSGDLVQREIYEYDTDIDFVH